MYYPSQFLYPIFVKKNEAKVIIKRQKFFLGSTCLALAIVQTVILYVVLPKMNALFVDSGIQKSVLTSFVQTFFPYFIGGLILFSVYIVLSNKFDNIYEEKLKNFKDDENILVADLLRTNLDWIVLILMLVSVGLLIATVVMPIYNLTNNF